LAGGKEPALPPTTFGGEGRVGVASLPLPLFEKYGEVGLGRWVCLQPAKVALVQWGSSSCCPTLLSLAPFACAFKSLVGLLDQQLGREGGYRYYLNFINFQLNL